MWWIKKTIMKLFHEHTGLHFHFLPPYISPKGFKLVYLKKKHTLYTIRWTKFKISLRENTMKLRETKFLQESVIYLPEVNCKFKSELSDGLHEEGNIAIASIIVSSKQRTIHLPRRDRILVMRSQRNLSLQLSLKRQGIEQGPVNSTVPPSTQSNALSSAVCDTTVVSVRHQLCTAWNSVMAALWQTGCL